MLCGPKALRWKSNKVHFASIFLFFCPIFIAGDLGQDWLRAFFNNDYDEMEALQTEALAEARHHVASWWPTRTIQNHPDHLKSVKHSSHSSHSCGTKMACDFFRSQELKWVPQSIRSSLTQMPWGFAFARCHWRSCLEQPSQRLSRWEALCKMLWSRRGKTEVALLKDARASLASFAKCVSNKAAVEIESSIEDDTNYAEEPQERFALHGLSSRLHVFRSDGDNFDLTSEIVWALWCLFLSRQPSHNLPSCSHHKVSDQSKEIQIPEAKRKLHTFQVWWPRFQCGKYQHLEAQCFWTQSKLFSS